MVITQQQFFKAMEEINAAFEKANKRIAELETRLNELQEDNKVASRRQRAAEKVA